MGLFRGSRAAGAHTEAYAYLTQQMKATGREHGDGYDPTAWDALTDAEKDQLEGKIWRKYFFGDLLIAVYLPKLRHHDGIAKLKGDLRRASTNEQQIFIADVLYRATGEGHYLDVLWQCCVDEHCRRLVAVDLQGYPTNAQTEQMLRDIYLKSTDGGTQMTALRGILHQRGIIYDVNDIQEFNSMIPVLRSLCVDDPQERLRLLEDYLSSAG